MSKKGKTKPGKPVKHDAVAVPRRADGTIMPGHSGNPKGRTTKLRSFAERIRLRLDGPDGSNRAIESLIGFAENPEEPTRNRMECWGLLLAYAYGKPIPMAESKEGGDDDATTAGARTALLSKLS